MQSTTIFQTILRKNYYNLSYLHQNSSNSINHILNLKHITKTSLMISQIKNGMKLSQIYQIKKQLDLLKSAMNISNMLVIKNKNLSNFLLTNVFNSKRFQLNGSPQIYF